MNDTSVFLLAAAAVIAWLLLCVLVALRQAAHPGFDAPSDMPIRVDSGLVLISNPCHWRLYPEVIRTEAEWPRVVTVQWLWFGLWWQYSKPTAAELRQFTEE